MSKNNNIAFKCTWNDQGFKGVCSQHAYEYNVAMSRAWCSKAKCRALTGKPTEENHPCYESILFTALRFGAGWDHKHTERPRKINNVKNGKICILTTLEPEQEESERKIIGFFKINKISDGEKEETIIYGDPSTSIEIDPNINVKFWDYYHNPKAPDKKRWGTGLFRYMDDGSISHFLNDLKERYVVNNVAQSEITKINLHLKDFSTIEIHKSQPPPQIQDGKRCGHCGYINAVKANFCNSCGKAFGIHCSVCDTINQAGSNYCLECGASLKTGMPHKPDMIVNKLLEFGKELKNEPPKYLFTPDKEADKLILEDPNAFLFAVIFDQGIGTEKAWAAPYELKKRIGHLDVTIIANLSEDDIGSYLRQKPKLHRFWPTMARRLKRACQLIVKKYNDNAKNIWADEPDARALYDRLMEFDGIGQKKSSMTVNILYRDLGVKIKNESGIDVSYDVMVRRIFLRTGLVKKDTLENVINTARQLHPSYPGELDYPAWYIGREWCLPKHPQCQKCPLKTVCGKGGV